MLHVDYKKCPVPLIYFPTSEGSKRCLFSQGGRIFCHEVFIRMYVPLALEVYDRLFIDNKGCMAVHTIKKHLLGFT